MYAPVAQSDRVNGFEPLGWGSESLQAHFRPRSSVVEQLPLKQLVDSSNLSGVTL